MDPYVDESAYHRAHLTLKSLYVVLVYDMYVFHQFGANLDLTFAIAHMQPYSHIGPNSLYVLVFVYLHR